MITLASGTFSVELPNPRLGDSNSPQNRVLRKQCMDGTYRTFRLASAIKTIISLSFVNLKTDQRDDLADFFANTAGEEITYTDYVSEDRTVKFVDTTLGFVSERNDRYQVDFQLELV